MLETNGRKLTNNSSNENERNDNVTNDNTSTKNEGGTVINGKVVFPKLVSIPEYVKLQKRVYNRDDVKNQQQNGEENQDYQATEDDDDANESYVSPWSSNISNYNKKRKKGIRKNDNRDSISASKNSISMNVKIFFPGIY